MDSIRASEAPDSGSIPDEVTKSVNIYLYWGCIKVSEAPDLDSLPERLYRKEFLRGLYLIGFF
jgi:hypothetical protein